MILRLHKFYLLFILNVKLSSNSLKGEFMVSFCLNDICYQETPPTSFKWGTSNNFRRGWCSSRVLLTVKVSGHFEIFPSNRNIWKCDRIATKIQVFNSWKWEECCERDWSDWISLKIQMNKIWRNLWWKLIQFVIINPKSLNWRSNEISWGNCVNWLYDKSRNWSWVSLLIWFDLRFKCVRFERQYNSDGMKESLL
jgi:hypothetical protein